MKKSLYAAVVLLVLAVAGFVTLRWYSYIFDRNVDGEIVGIERVTQPDVIIGNTGAVPPSQLYSFAVAIRDEKNHEIVTASTEDRQWAVAHKGLCAEAKFFPYPFWEIQKAGTYFGARLMRLYDCPGKPAASNAPAADATAAAPVAIPSPIPSPRPVPSSR